METTELTSHGVQVPERFTMWSCIGRGAMGTDQPCLAAAIARSTSCAVCGEVMHSEPGHIFPG